MIEDELELKKARTLFKRRKFSAVISLLEPRILNFRESFEYYYLLGVSCMYTGDIGGAQDYLKRASQLCDDNPSLLLAQASMFLRRGDTAQAVDGYLEVLEYEPQNKTAKKAMTFIRTKGDIATISQWVASGRIKRFYPNPGLYIPVLPIAAALGAVALVALAVFLVRLIPEKMPQRADLSDLALSADDRRNPVDMQGGVYNTILTSDEINTAYNRAIKYFQATRDNAAQVEINRILNSNANNKIRSNARQLMEYLQEPVFGGLSDKYSYSEVAATPFLYQDCWVQWSGRVANVRIGESFYECDFLIGYENMRNYDGIVQLVIPQPVTIDPERPIEVLAKVDIRNNALLLRGKNVHQPIASANK